tara:strand:+ start:49 stop:363 length:315 start_codon:yes stop_codon:yes gene_type:complete
MKYTKQIIFFFILNLIVVFLSIFTGNLTRKLELSNNQIQLNIEKEKDQLQINKIEFSYYNTSDYLKKLYNIYFTFEEDHPEKKIVSLSNITDIKKESLIFVNIK